ncbi:hypothetical protein [Candidatus Thiothrix anitrata]|uniref:Uncharacterized protein n=1 Tax=Candidatus Thiothrix anitrata TaxID=2823902 RepID=A0ABX7X4I3_9GAMM|nr:hypothetical protein [Candidatus Thiothrix anitrata]QTR50736.1 hypothetical protein J8380_03970 [Candidatus Thiothrix anitrata]
MTRSTHIRWAQLIVKGVTSPVYQADDSLALKVGVKMEPPLCRRLTLVDSVSANSDGSTIADKPSSRAAS